MTQQTTSPSPELNFPAELPIVEKRAQIAELIGAHQVVVIAGETGSGKTTQLPKICLDLGRGSGGMIGHTQPRRIAARSVAARIAEELKLPLGGVVGYQVRFSDQSDHSTRIKLMTDGILLMEVQQDPLLRKYDTLIIDEAHERSLNIDFLLGYLKQLLPKRPDLKLIITSATIDLERFAKHFDGAPVLEVSGRTYPVELLYRPWQDAFETLTDAIVHSIDEISRSLHGKRGDVLVFLSGEREIRETSLALRRAALRDIEVLPLYGRLSANEQHRIFQQHKGMRVVLATNVAETSVTVPGIRYVIDPGYARISRYSLRTKVQRLPVEAISQASANQRKGRCGRLSDGVCIRLYSEEDFLSRPLFTDPEILRTNLAAVILHMLQLRIGQIRRFPFIDPPDSKLINDGFKLLEEIQAVDQKGRVTALGKQLGRLPVDPRFARMLIAASNHGCLAEVIIIVSGLSLQDVRERPREKQQAADEKHRRFDHEHSDFLSYVNVWQYLEEKRVERSSSQFRKCCQKEYLNYLRVREWRDLHRQISLEIKRLGFSVNTEPAKYESLHRALLSGMVSNVGYREEVSKKDRPQPGRRRERPCYLGTRNRRFQLFPTSSLSKKLSVKEASTASPPPAKRQNKSAPKWIVAADFIETSQLFAHCVAKVDVAWVVDAAGDLLKYHYFEPHYEAKSGQVKAFARVTLFGLVVIEKKTVSYQRIDAQVAHDIFIREALVGGAYRGKAAFFEHNQAVIEKVKQLEAKARRRDILVDDEYLVRFYQEQVPKKISNLAGFEHWYQTASADNPHVLFLSTEQVMLHTAAGVSEAQFPDALDIDGISLPLVYHFEPGHEDDGVSVCVPVALLHALPEARLQWLVPGLLRDKCIALVKALPKKLRKQLVPVPHYVDRAIADRAMANLKASERPLTEALAEAFKRLAGLDIEEQDWALSGLDDFYRMNIWVLGEDGNVLARDRDLHALRQRYKQQLQQGLARGSEDFERQGIHTWDFAELPESVQIPQPGALKNVEMTAYPALIDRESHVDIKLVDNPHAAAMLSQKGVLRLAALSLGKNKRLVSKDLLRGKTLGLTQVDLGTPAQVEDQLLLAALRDACFVDAFPVREQAVFEGCISKGKAEVYDVIRELAGCLTESLSQVVAIKKTMKTHRSALALTFCFADIKQQLGSLFYPNFLLDMPREQFRCYPRYLKAIGIRLEKAALDPRRDQLQTKELATLWLRHSERLEKEGTLAYQHNSDWQSYRWMIEEYRVSLFAQVLKTSVSVSAKRLDKLWQVSLK